MGCGMSTEEKEGKARNEEIENQLKKDKLMQRNEIKMLLLGMITINLSIAVSLLEASTRPRAFSHANCLYQVPVNPESPPF